MTPVDFGVPEVPWDRVVRWLRRWFRESTQYRVLEGEEQRAVLRLMLMLDERESRREQRTVRRLG